MFNARPDSITAVAIADAAVRMRGHGSRWRELPNTASRRIAHPIFRGVSR